jgi:hypothetical protein
MIAVLDQRILSTCKFLVARQMNPLSSIIFEDFKAFIKVKPFLMSLYYQSLEYVDFLTLQFFECYWKCYWLVLSSIMKNMANSSL